LVVPSARSKNRCAAVASRRADQHVNDLAEQVERLVHIAAPAGDLHVGLVHQPAVPDRMPVRPSGVGQQRRESLHPAVDGDVVDLDAAFGEQLLDVAVGL
jgi:hypothetical protein